MMPISDEGLDLADPREEAAVELMRGPSGKWREDRLFQLRALEQLGLRADHQLLEIGCGPLLAGLPLMRFLDRGRYTGVDVSTDRLAAGRKAISQFALEDRQAHLVRSDSFGLAELPPGSFDRIWSYQVVLHLTEPLVHGFMRAVAALLKQDGIAWFSAKVSGRGDAFEVGGPWLEFPVNAVGEGFYRSAADAAGLTCASLGTLGELGLPSDRPGSRHLLFEMRHAR